MNEAAPSSGLNSLHGQRSHNSNELYTIELYRVQCTIPGPRRRQGARAEASYPLCMLCGRVHEWVIVKVARLC